jgi:Transposase DDE domain
MERRMAQIEASVARYLRQLDSADRQEPSDARTTKTSRLKEKIAKLKEEMQRLQGLKARMLAAPDQQISLTDPDSRSMATSGRGSGVVGYNVQVAVDTEHHLIITHEVTNVGSDRAQLARMAKETKATLERTSLDAIADRGYFSSEEILKCAKADITVTLPKPMTSNPKRFGKQDFRYVAEEDVYICPAGERLAYSFDLDQQNYCPPWNNCPVARGPRFIWADICSLEAGSAEETGSYCNRRRRRVGSPEYQSSRPVHGTCRRGIFVRGGVLAVLRSQPHGLSGHGYQYARNERPRSAPPRVGSPQEHSDNSDHRLSERQRSGACAQGRSHWLPAEAFQ